MTLWGVGCIQAEAGGQARGNGVESMEHAAWILNACCVCWGEEGEENSGKEVREEVTKGH